MYFSLRWAYEYSYAVISGGYANTASGTYVHHLFYSGAFTTVTLCECVILPTLWVYVGFITDFFESWFRRFLIGSLFFCGCGSLLSSRLPSFLAYCDCFSQNLLNADTRWRAAPMRWLPRNFPQYCRTEIQPIPARRWVKEPFIFASTMASF